jgi:hypothetical protein
MLKSFKIIAKKYVAKNGNEFMKLSCKGQFLPVVTAQLEEYYTIKFTKNSLAKEPVNDGVYSIAYEEGKCWIDDRPENYGKNIVRVEVQRIQFEKPLTAKEK